METCAIESVSKILAHGTLLTANQKLNVTGTSMIAGILRRKRLSIAVSLLICAIACFTLYQVLHDINTDAVVAALRHQSGRTILAAGGFVVAGYVTLTLYDFFALRTIERREVPFQAAAFASFTSYTIGHTLGAATLTGGAVRLRIYSAWGLTVADIAKIAFVTGLTFWLGTALVLGSALLLAPEAASVVDHLPLWAHQIAGLSALLCICGYLVWLAPRPRRVGYRNWSITLPGVPFALLQTAIGATDLSLVALAMYTLLPVSPVVDFPTLAVVFLIATLLGTISHAPGSLGVMEATMLIGLPQLRKEELLATLLTFRVLYFVLPLLLAALAFSLREVWLAMRLRSISSRS